MSRSSNSIPVSARYCCRSRLTCDSTRTGERSVRCSVSWSRTARRSARLRAISFRLASRRLARRCHGSSEAGERVERSLIESVSHEITENRLDNSRRHGKMEHALDVSCHIPFRGTKTVDTFDVYAVSVPEQSARPLATFQQATRFPSLACSLFPHVFLRFNHRGRGRKCS